VGPDPAFLEGVSQTLGGAGHQTIVASDLAEAQETLRGLRPLLALVDREVLMTRGGSLGIPLARGGALLAFRRSDDNDAEHFPFRLERATLAELHLPLERKRLLALVKSVEERARACGRTDADAAAVEDEARPR